MTFSLSKWLINFPEFCTWVICLVDWFVLILTFETTSVSPHFLFSLITPETKRWHLDFTPCPHFFDYNQEQNDATPTSVGSNNNILFSHNLITLTDSIKVYALTDSDHKLHNKKTWKLASHGNRSQIALLVTAVITNTPYLINVGRCLKV